MKKTFPVLIILIFLVSCSQSYVCPDGSIVKSPDKCKVDSAEKSSTQEEAYGEFEENQEYVEESDLEIIQHNAIQDGNYKKIVGEVKNNGKDVVNFVMITATLYNKDGKIVGTDLTYARPSDIKPGQTVPFQVLILNKEFEKYKLQVSSS